MSAPPAAGAVGHRRVEAPAADSSSAMAEQDLTDLLGNLDDDPRRRGRQFEAICRWYLLNDPVYRAQLREVWLWDYWTGRWGADAGIDLVAETHDGHLWAIQAKAYDPGPSARVLDVDPADFRKREWRRILKRAQLPHRPIKDLRDTFASQLLTAGAQLGYISRQLGHSDVSVTARHYARWAGGDAYRSPLEVREDEAPADLLSRLAEKSPQNPHSAAQA